MFRPSVRQLCLLASLLSLIAPTVKANYGSYECKRFGDVVSSGVFTDPTFAPIASPFNTTGCAPQMPVVYMHNLECTYTFNAPAGQHIYIEFVMFSVDSSCGQDYISIDTHSNSGSRTLCGRRPEVLYDVSTSGSMTVTFVTNDKRRCEGWTGMFMAFTPATKRRRRTIGSRLLPHGALTAHKRLRRSLDIQPLHQEEALHYRETHLSELMAARLKMNLFWEKKDFCQICMIQEGSVALCTCNLDVLQHETTNIYTHGSVYKRSLDGRLAPGRPRLRTKRDEQDCTCV